METTGGPRMGAERCVPAGYPRQPDNLGGLQWSARERSDDVLDRPGRRVGPRRARQDQPRRRGAERPADGVCGPDPPALGQEPPAGAEGQGRRPDPVPVGPDERLSAQDARKRGRPLLHRARGEGRPERPARTPGDVVLETAFDMDFKPAAEGRRSRHVRIDTPGVYLVRIETRQTQSDHEHFCRHRPGGRGGRSPERQLRSSDYFSLLSSALPGSCR